MDSFRNLLSRQGFFSCVSSGGCNVAVNEPIGDKARKGAVRKRSQVKTKLGGATAWTKRNKTSGEFMR
jgi:hypothetical protein